VRIKHIVKTLILLLLCISIIHALIACNYIRHALIAGQIAVQFNAEATRRHFGDAPYA
jgi:hypothetical protein